MQEGIIEFKNFYFKYRAQKEPTLHDINLSIKAGEKVLIVGPSGSGKSTLGECLNGLIPCSFPGEIRGEVRVDGKNPAQAGIFSMAQSVGTVLQNPDAQFVGLTVGEDIAFSMENSAVPQAEMHKIVQQNAQLVDMEKFLGQNPQSLSGGQKQRVCLAGVLSDDTKILLFDEPLANLDPATGKYAMELIDRIHKEKRATIIIIEHRLEDVLTSPVDRIVVMQEGRIVADDVPDNILATDILQKVGIREPLYITAMRYAGCAILPEMHLASLSELDLEGQKEKVRHWYESLPEGTATVSDEEPLLHVDNISYQYNEEKKVLDDVSLQVHAGEMLSIVGKNGAGKTTLSKIICGFIRRIKGAIHYKKADITQESIANHAKKIGLVMQNPYQMISQSIVYDEVALGLRTRNFSEAETKKRVEETLRICGLYPFRNWPISALSFGQKKRVTIAAILVLKPEILILDEPTAGQDFHHYTDIMEFLQKLNREQNITILMITHDMHLMLEYTNRAIVLSAGQLLADTKCAAVLTDINLIDHANLKLTSLYFLAEKCGIENKEDFVQRFIAYDRKVRAR